jgi:hypothetical protein
VELLLEAAKPAKAETLRGFGYAVLGVGSAVAASARS